MHTCPRRIDKIENADFYMKDDNCNYCGSLNPDVFMQRLEAGDVLLSATTKNYKVYVLNKDGKLFQIMYREGKEPFAGYYTDDWVINKTNQAKFYFQHLSQEQKIRFVELFNQKKLLFEQGGHFTVLPFFVGT